MSDELFEAVAIVLRAAVWAGVAVVATGIGFLIGLALG